MPIKNWFYLKKDAAGIRKDTIEDPTDTYVNIVDVDSPNSGNVMSVSDFAAQSRPYKVYTALLTQSGGDNPLNLLSQDSPMLTIGVTYQITDDGGSGWDFTNVGAPNNDLNTSFVATGTTPANWGSNAMLSYNTGAPVVTVLENTIGDVFFDYDDPGSYIIIGDFPLNKTTFVISNIGEVSSDDISIRAYIDTDNIYITTTAIPFSGTSAYADGILNNTPIEIRVYN